MKLVALAGGVGGAKLVDGLAKVLPADDLTVIVNTGDDFCHFGLYICPDLDTVCYTLAGLSNPETGWGRAEETWNALDNIKELGGPSWFRLGDRDLGVHLERTRLLSQGRSLTEICHQFCSTWQVIHQVLPMSDDPVATLVHTSEGDFPFQDYFVKHSCQPQVSGFDFVGADTAVPAPGVIDSIQAADLIVICPSNPWVSIDPILSVPGIKEVLRGIVNLKPVIAVSPIIQGKTIKGPAAKMFTELGIEPTAVAVARHYGNREQGGLLSGFVFDDLDAGEQYALEGLGIPLLQTNTIMKSTIDKNDLARKIIQFGETLIDKQVN